MNLESVTGAIKHIWGFFVPPLLNLIVLVSLCISMVDLSWVSKTQAPENSGAPVTQATQNDSITNITAGMIDKLFKAIGTDADLPKVVKESTQVLKEIFQFMASMAQAGFTALLYAFILVVSLMLIVDLLTRAFSGIIKYALEAVKMYEKIKKLHYRIITRGIKNWPALGAVWSWQMNFVTSPIRNSQSVCYVRAQLSKTAASASFSNYEIYEVSLAWLSKNATNSQWKTDRDARLERIAVLEQVIHYIRAYVFLLPPMFLFLAGISCGNFPLMLRVIGWEIILLLGWLVLILAVVVARRGVMRSDIDACRFYHVAVWDDK